MTTKEQKPASKLKNTVTKEAPQSDRKGRLSEALRQNLQRRKAKKKTGAPE